MRARIAERIAWLGVALDPAADAACETLISRPESRVRLYMTPTDEELMIARHTLALLSRVVRRGWPAKPLPVNLPRAASDFRI